jgi:prevent-host-death family protein
MAKVNLYEAKTRLSELVRNALAGEEVIIAKDGKPAVRLVPCRQVQSVQAGFLKGKVRWTDDFDAPIEDLKEYT